MRPRARRAASREELRLSSHTAVLQAEEGALAARQAASRLELERDDLSSRLLATQQVGSPVAVHRTALCCHARRPAPLASDAPSLARRASRGGRSCCARRSMRRRSRPSGRPTAAARRSTRRSWRASRRSCRLQRHPTGRRAGPHRAERAPAASGLPSPHPFAKSARGALDAEVASLKRQLAEAREKGTAASGAQAAQLAELQAALAAREKDVTAWKAKWKAQADSSAEGAEQLAAAERRLMSEAAEHAGATARLEARVAELTTQLESGAPSERQMFNIARDQAKRDEEVGKLRTQLKTLREMLRESHKVMKHLVRQEGLLKEELKQTKRKTEMADHLNVEYLKNVVVSFLVKVYGDAEDEEHIKLARVLQILLNFSADDVQRVDEQIEAYNSSWWHRTANLLKPAEPSTLWGQVFG
eukprot:882516-Prymnesium_polylepis.2